MAFTGTWKRTRAENGVELLQLIGMPEAMIQAMDQLQFVLILNQVDDNTIEETLQMGENKNSNTIKIGSTTTLVQWDGKRVNAVPERINDKKYKICFNYDGHDYKFIRELLKPTELLDTLDIDNGKVVSKLYHVKS